MKHKFPNISTKYLQTPCFVVDESSLERNGKILHSLEEKANCKVILALKGYACFETFPLIRQYISGVCSGNLYETILGAEEFRKEVHTYSPAFRESEFPAILSLSDHIIFNSISQMEKFKPIADKSKYNRLLGLRINPEKSVAGALYGAYDPCTKNSRLGVKLNDLKGKNLGGISGLHFHALCEQGADELEIVLNEFDKKFGPYIRQMSWVNFGGGHHITKKGYDIKKLTRMISGFRERYPNIKDVYLEPGEAVALNAGVLVSSVVDIVKNEKKIAIIDSSVETHFPDVMITRHEPSPYMQEIIGAKPIRPGEKPKYDNVYTLAGVSCAAGDVFGDYSFKKKLHVGDKLIFTDAAHYTMVKTSTFCGVPLPSIYVMGKDGNIRLIRKFIYSDYTNRLT